MDKIVDKLYLGNLKGASDMQALHKAGITHILQVASGIRPFFPKDSKEGADKAAPKFGFPGSSPPTSFDR